MRAYFRFYIVSIFLFIMLTGLQAQVTDADVKVAYIYRFTKYIEWYNHSKTGIFTIGVFEDDELMLDKMNYLARTRKIKNKKIVIVTISNINQLKKKQLNILCVNTERNKNIIKIFSHITGKNTLLISDNCPVKEAVMINFLPSIKKDIVLFELNKKNAINEDLIIHPDILLLGGTYIDVRKLFREKELE